MKKISFLYKIPFLLLVLSLASCNEDEFLSIDETGALSSDVYLSTEAEVESAMAGVYNKIQLLQSNDSWQSLYLAKNLPADDCLAGSSSGDQTDYQYLDDFQISSDNTKVEAIWTNLYTVINRANTIINDADPTISDNVVEMIAEAKAIRAYSYLELATLFGGVPIRTENAVEASDYHLARSTADEVYAQIETDFLEAIEDLPLKSEYASADKYRMSKGAAQGFLGKAYLYQEEYAKAATQFENVISSVEYDLVSDFSTVWKQAEEFGNESLFETSYTSTMAYTWSTYSWDSSEECNIEVQLQGPRSAIFVLGNTSLEINNGWGFNMPSEKIALAFDAEADAVRKAATVMSADDFIATGGSIADGIEAFVTHDYEGYMRLKYATWKSETDNDATPDLNYTTNFRLLRYADILLMAAEAHNALGEDATALTELNEVRTRAGLANVSASGDALFDAIVTERQLELCFEGVRYWDLIRWGLAEQELGSLGYESNKNELFPIPDNEIISNNLIDLADQNPGY
ncbi:RagB/SusD family nutrient uptake outer membrane protein [Labilibaculum sp.]|uniref:RagB/SusD family nutrient uptake outer membrane protein n=1 Tax=Labilibaculum sp. TaxID=2060723 RepID=UPI00356646F6